MTIPDIIIVQNTFPQAVFAPVTYLMKWSEELAMYSWTVLLRDVIMELFGNVDVGTNGYKAYHLVITFYREPFMKDGNHYLHKIR